MHDVDGDQFVDEDGALPIYNRSRLCDGPAVLDSPVQEEIPSVQQMPSSFVCSQQQTHGVRSTPIMPARGDTSCLRNLPGAGDCIISWHQPRNIKEAISYRPSKESPNEVRNVHNAGGTDGNFSRHEEGRGLRFQLRATDSVAQRLGDAGIPAHSALRVVG